MTELRRRKERLKLNKPARFYCTVILLASTLETGKVVLIIEEAQEKVLKERKANALVLGVVRGWCLAKTDCRLQMEVLDKSHWWTQQWVVDMDLDQADFHFASYLRDSQDLLENWHSHERFLHLNLDRLLNYPNPILIQLLTLCPRQRTATNNSYRTYWIDFTKVIVGKLRCLLSQNQHTSEVKYSIMWVN